MLSVVDAYTRECFSPGSGYESRESESKSGAGAGKPGNEDPLQRTNLRRSTLSGIRESEKLFRPARGCANVGKDP